MTFYWVKARVDGILRLNILCSHWPMFKHKCKIRPMIKNTLLCKPLLSCFKPSWKENPVTCRLFIWCRNDISGNDICPQFFVDIKIWLKTQFVLQTDESLKCTVHRLSYQSEAICLTNFSYSLIISVQPMTRSIQTIIPPSAQHR